MLHETFVRIIDEASIYSALEQHKIKMETIQPASKQKKKKNSRTNETVDENKTLIC